MQDLAARPGKLKNLEELSLDFDKVSDKGMKEIGTIQSLRTLGLGATDVTDAGMGDAKNLKNLRLLLVWGTRVTDAGVREIKRLCRCARSRSSSPSPAHVLARVSRTSSRIQGFSGSKTAMPSPAATFNRWRSMKQAFPLFRSSSGQSDGQRAGVQEMARHSTLVALSGASLGHRPWNSSQ